MKHRHYIDALTILADVELKYDVYKNINRQNMFNFSRFIGKNVNFDLVRETLLAHEYDSFESFVNHLRTVFVQDLLFYSEYSRWIIPLHGLDFIQQSLKKTPKIDMIKARSAIHTFLDQAGHDNVMMLRYSPTLFGLPPGRCISECIVNLETQQYNTIDKLYHDLSEVGRHYCDSIPVKKQSLRLRMLSLQLQVNYNNRTIKEKEDYEEFRNKRVKWCNRYILRYTPGKSFNLLYYKEKVVPDLDRHSDKERNLDFNRWYKCLNAGTLQTKHSLPEWMHSLANSSFSSKAEASAAFTQKWDVFRREENDIFAFWLFDDPSRMNLDHPRSEFKKAKDSFMDKFSKTVQTAFEQWKQTNEGRFFNGKASTVFYETFLPQHVEYQNELKQWNETGSAQEFDNYCAQLDYDRIVDQSKDETFNKWCVNNGFNHRSGKGLRIAFEKSRNIRQNRED